MKIKFKKFEPTSTFIKLFGGNRHKSGKDSSDAGELDESDDVYEYYYKRGNMYYFRNNEGNKLTIDYHEPQPTLIRGHKYKIDAINNTNS